MVNFSANFPEVLTFYKMVAVVVSDQHTLYTVLSRLCVIVIIVVVVLAVGRFCTSLLEGW